MKCFIGLSLLMGVIYKPRIPMYWSTDDMLSTPLFGQVMTRDRYLLITKFLHFSNNRDLTNDQNEDRDRLHKVRPFIRKIQERCRRVYEPSQYLSVDEPLLLYKGRLCFKQFIRTKRARFGIKLCTHDGITLDLFRDQLNPEPDMLATE
ncbi:hypothetical protein SNE40_023027 [Patella caerulea]|uniref:PiggyBac transposable element-derived protein domain-containing protein n=1 Tax=Patella caerulea TaxID=87958 RepID=A0AAN8G9B7_PATCE